MITVEIVEDAFAARDLRLFRLITLVLREGPRLPLQVTVPLSEARDESALRRRVREWIHVLRYGP